MMAFLRMPSKTFQRNMFNTKKKPLEEIKGGEGFDEILDIARFSPSVHNSQP
jgi:nitroreductase